MVLMVVLESNNVEWRPIIFKGIDFTGKYEVSEYGEVRSLNYNNQGFIKILTPYKNSKGYLVYRLNYKGETYVGFSHRLVAIAFIPNPNDLPLVNHKDENKLNNHYSNLEWCDINYNCNYGTRNQRLSIANTGHKHSNETKEKIRKASLDRGTISVVQLDSEGNFIAEWKSATFAAKSLGVCNHISDCCKGLRDHCGGYRWMYSKDYYK